MINIGNDIVTLESRNGLAYRVVNNEGAEVGKISLSDSDPAEIYIEIAEAERGKHYASNAVYILDSFAHREKQVKTLFASISKDQEMARHVLEHSGYYITDQGENHIKYEHIMEETQLDDSYDPGAGNKVIYLAGGCFWGTERAFRALDGVIATRTGYANGHLDHPSYEDIIRNETGFKETVRVTYDPARVSLDTVLTAYFLVTDPTQANRQGDDEGTQYQSGIYYRDPADQAVISAFLDKERLKHDAFYVDLKPMECFYEAEEYHQDYLSKNPDGYCHISFFDIEKIRALNKNEPQT